MRECGGSGGGGGDGGGGGGGSGGGVGGGGGAPPTIKIVDNDKMYVDIIKIWLRQKILRS